jgi:hypothetical protein
LWKADKVMAKLTWFYFHVALVLIVLVKDYNGTLEESFDRFEKKIGLYTPPDSTVYEDPPYYIPPIQDEESILDSNYVNN